MYRRTRVLLVVVMTVVANPAVAETFEYLTFTPPKGWTSRTVTDGTAYVRAAQNGIGAITLLASRPTTAAAAQAFAAQWSSHVEPVVHVPAPEPQLHRQGDYTLAIGARQAASGGATLTAALVVFVGKGRVLGVIGMAGSDDALREVTVFLDSLAIAGAPAAAPAPATPPAPPRTGAGTTPPPLVASGEIELDFDVPPGYSSRRDGRAIVFAPATVDDNTPCTYGLLPSRAATGTLEQDAIAALVEVLPGWQRSNDRYNAMRGIAAAGWPYHWYRTDMQRVVNGSTEYLSVMTMAFPGAKGRVNIAFGVGSPARCLHNDLCFARLLHGLRPRGWTSDGGKALVRELVGTWRFSERAGIMQYKFLAGGRYEFGLGATTQIGMRETTSSSVRDGTYELRAGELVLTPQGRPVSRLRVRIYDEYVAGKWTRAMSLLDEAARPPLEVQYMRIDESR